ncbi:MAG TPA: PAS domain S-box protein [Candidatus Acidoferrales bacterium]|nr:PAS domain S-box protein [Candidatus Acidoferrales bacterium]
MQKRGTLLEDVPVTIRVPSRRDPAPRGPANSLESTLAAIVTFSSDAIYSIGRDHVVLSWNAGAERLLGHRAEDVVGKRSPTLTPEVEAQMEDILHRVLDDRETLEFETRRRRKDGVVLDVAMTAAPILDQAGIPTAIAVVARDITERKRSERDHALLAAIVESSEDAIVSNSLDLRITSWNKGAQTMFGFTAEEAIGQPASLYMPPEMKAWGIDFLGDLRDRLDQAQSFEVPCMRKDGSRVDAWTVCAAIRNTAGELIGFSAIHRDITERKRAERQEALLAAIVESSDDAITSLSTDGLFTSFNHGAEKLFGISAEQAIGHPLGVAVPPEFRSHAEFTLAEDLAMLHKHPGVVRRLEVSFPRREGAATEVLLVVCGIYDRAGRLLGLSQHYHDITERKRAERELAQLAAVVNASHDAIMNVSPDARIITWNPAAEAAYGYTAEEAIGKTIELFVPPEELEQTIATTRRVVETGQPASWEQHARRRDGTPFISAVNIFPIRDAAGAVTSVAGIGRDITMLKETERQLVGAREAALEASRAKSEFLSSMSHEIRTPMTAILGMAELLSDGELNPEQRRYIEILCNNGHALLELINSILDLAKVESGRLTLEHVAFDVAEVVERAAQALAIRAHAKQLELIVNLSPDIPTALMGDPLRLRQVLINLIGNAIKFTERGEVAVSVERDPAPGNPLRLKFSVRDTGIGIAKDKLPALFAAFAQADSSTARKYGGSGLGLAIVRRLVGLMRGEVAVESEPGKGSTFSFTSPFDVCPAPPAPAPWPELAGVPVLIVDHNKAARAVLSRMLSGRGASVTEAATYSEGLTAIECAAGKPIRIVLLDDRIASSDTREPAQLIAAAARCGGSVIAMIHCDNLAADISRLRSIKLEAYLVKPIERGELAKALRHALTDDGGEVQQSNRVAAPGAVAPPVVDRPLKILFADDSPDNRTLIRAFLKHTRYRLDEVENGRQAIDRFIAGNYDLVLMDIQMPEVDGYAATRAIRDFEREHDRAHTPIIALTASVFSDAVRLTRAAGCDAHVAKPVNKSTLLRAIYDAVGASRQL